MGSGGECTRTTYPFLLQAERKEQSGEGQQTKTMNSATPLISKDHCCGIYTLAHIVLL